jgi:5-methylcytosine-specific restriction protein A
MADRQELFTPREAALFMRYKETTLGIWRSNAEGPAYLKLGHAIRYRRRDLEEWLYGGSDVRRKIEETAQCHVEKRRNAKRPRGRAAVEWRKRQLAAEPHCRDCRDRGYATPAEEVDHIVPLEDGGTNHDENLRSLCRACHRARTKERWDKKR